MENWPSPGGADFQQFVYLRDRQYCHPLVEKSFFEVKLFAGLGKANGLHEVGTVEVCVAEV
jgi:hypothetical protein